jgi:hypothetical protein
MGRLDFTLLHINHVKKRSSASTKSLPERRISARTISIRIHYMYIRRSIQFFSDHQVLDLIGCQFYGGTASGLWGPWDGINV